MKDRRLTPKQIENLLANNPHKIVLEKTSEAPKTDVKIQFRSSNKKYDTLESAERIRDFCTFIRDVISRYEENERRQEEAETMEMDIKHAIELSEKPTEKEKKLLYNKLTDVLQTRRACKSENEILQPLYNYFNDKVLLNKMNQLQGTITSMREIIENRTYSCRTSILEDLR